MKSALRFPLLRAIPFLVLAWPSAHAYFVADGVGLHQVVVHVWDRKMNPLEAATVELKNAGEKRVSEDQQFKKYLKVFQPTATNIAGDAMVYYFAGFSSTPEGATQSVVGTLHVSKPGYDDFSLDLAKLLGSTSIKTDPGKVPQVFVLLEKKK